MSRILSPLCPVCGRPFPNSPSSPDHLCGDCAQPSFYFNAARSAVIHVGVVRDRIHQYKFDGKLEWIPPLVELCELTCKAWEMAVPDFLVPVPLHRNRLKERGFNQSGLLARELARKMGWRVSFDVLARRIRTQPQTRLNRGERLKNVRGAFEVTRPSEVRDRRILLIDDVFTTGETLSECARTLKDAGAREVYALTVTRALPDK